MKSGARGYEEIFRQNRFPLTGEIVRCRKSGTLWRVMERELWQRLEEDSLTGESRIVPLFYFSLWRLQEGVPLRVGEMQGYLCRRREIFAADWELVSSANVSPAVAAPERSPFVRLH